MCAVLSFFATSLESAIIICSPQNKFVLFMHCIFFSIANTMIIYVYSVNYHKFCLILSFGIFYNLLYEEYLRIRVTQLLFEFKII